MVTAHLKTKPYILYVGNRHAYKKPKLMMESNSSSREAIKEFDIIFFFGGKLSTKDVIIITGGVEFEYLNSGV